MKEDEKEGEEKGRGFPLHNKGTIIDSSLVSIQYDPLKKQYFFYRCRKEVETYKTLGNLSSDLNCLHEVQ